MNKIAFIKSKFGKKEFKPKLSSLIKVNSFIENLIEDINKLPDDNQRQNFLDKFKKNIFMSGDVWYRDLDEESKMQFHNLEIKYVTEE